MQSICEWLQWVESTVESSRKKSVAFDQKLSFL
ncbi:hypothetical protein EMIT053CA3_150041 [Pseudomonas donghuensis]